MNLMNTFIVSMIWSMVSGHLEFVAYGDWGDATHDLKTTIASINKLASQRDFNLLMGDNFYPAGITSLTDKRFATLSNIVMANTNTVHHLALGNHDYRGNPAVEMAYSKQNKLWDLPTPYYKRVHVKDGVTICLIVIDTIQWNPIQASWVETQLKSPECDTKSSWTIVSGHYPIWSSGAYSDTANLKSSLLPLLHQYGVQLYLCGHEHLHEVFYDGSTVQVTSGAVAQVRGALEFQPHPLQIWGVSGSDVTGYLRVEVTDSGIEVHIVSGRSNLDFQTFTITRDGTKKSMFGHIKWSYKNSNADEIVARSVPITDLTTVAPKTDIVASTATTTMTTSTNSESTTKSGAARFEYLAIVFLLILGM